MREVDKDGNMLFFANEGIFLKLKSESAPRKIFNFRGREIIKYVKRNNIMKPIDGAQLIGFNYNALMMINENRFIKDKKITVVIGKTAYKVKVEDILNLKEFLHFKQQGFELQCFFPVEKMETVIART